MKKIYIFLIISSAILVILMVTIVPAILNQNSMAHANDPAPTKEAQSNQQGQDIHYPDPSNQDALPNSVKVTGSNETALLRAIVKEGQQIYECQASTTDPSGYAWNLQAPFALLQADEGTNVIHSTGPVWLYTADGSIIQGKVGQFTNPDGTVVPASATPDAKAIPWLRLDVINHLGSKGLFSNVNEIQRLYTVKGKAPAVACNHETANKHTIKQVDYTAEYVFWGPKN